MRPSIRPMARWIGCMMPRKVPKGSSVMPERLVSTQTEKAPSCSVMMQPSREARMIFARAAPFPPMPENRFERMMGRQIR